jgi:DNA-binding LytR/AlgR family response regulator
MNDKKIHCLIVDDEPPALLLLEKYIHAIPILLLVGKSANAVDALAILQQHPVDLIFLDIQMPHILGTDFIRALIDPPKVVFTTAFRKFAVEGFELDAVDYLLKPISFERFLKAVNKVMKLNLPIDQTFSSDAAPKKDPEPPFLLLRADRKNLKVQLQDILFIESLKDYVKVVTKERSIVSKQSISAFAKTLPEDAFLRIHRSFIVSVSMIESFTSEIIQIAKYELPVSRTYRHEVEKALMGAITNKRGIL